MNIPDHGDKTMAVIKAQEIATDLNAMYWLKEGAAYDLLSENVLRRMQALCDLFDVKGEK